MKIGIIGLGKMGQNHLNELARNSHFKINALFDLYQSPNLSQFNNIFFNDLDEFIKQDNDIIIIATPTNSHLDIAKKVLNSAKVLLIEKPLALNLAQIEELKKIAQNKKIAVGFCERFNPAVLALKQNLKNEKIISINIQRFSPYPQRINDVGILHDLAVHDLDLISFLSQKNITKAKIIKRFTQDANRESESIISCELGEIIASLHQSWNCSLRLRKIHLITEKHFFEADLANFKLFKDDKEIQIEKNSPLFNEHQALLNLINNEDHFLASIDDAYRVQKILEEEN
ncbi:Gfo/Idh/MocA family protein [Campylobacter estrildidarum]|uniref:Gfo/Idh/MocA family oxidoreductase n=1 Tax=Campylobacter estrildidarum TaxID=2510189 RepID=A0A4U7BPK8_9BACT|nr:Gfo/Idh/MocA family oxidoreductase [Campylobacter estrildidarum]TKX32160.1 gfo/Idh/MocA family oxidoreductase [Campylobacter estrildidarum]